MESIQFILERLSWPVRFAKVQAARACAELFADPVLGAKAAQAYLAWLSSRQTENETCSGLVVLFATDQLSLPARELVEQHLGRPSLLSNFMLNEVYGTARPLDSGSFEHSGAAPGSFEPPSYFARYQSAQVPPSLKDEFERLERLSGLPFIKQWAFEWDKVRATINAPLSGFPYHFLEAALERSGVSAQADQRQNDVYRSAFLRTLHCAIDVWKMPRAIASTAARKCLPVNRGLIDIERADRPYWLDELLKACSEDSAPPEVAVRDVFLRAVKSGGLVPVHLRSPLPREISEFSSLAVSCSLLSDDYVPLPHSEVAAIGGTPWILPNGSMFAGEPPQLGVDDYFRPTAQGKRLPLCVDVFPFPFGYWLGDLFHLGLCLPAAYAFSRPITYRCTDGGIATELDQQQVGRWTTWNDHWTNVYPKGGTTRCACLTEMRRDDVMNAARRLGFKVGWTVDIKLWKSDHSFGELKLSHRSFVVVDDGSIFS